MMTGVDLSYNDINNPSVWAWQPHTSNPGTQHPFAAQYRHPSFPTSYSQSFQPNLAENFTRSGSFPKQSDRGPHSGPPPQQYPHEPNSAGIPLTDQRPYWPEQHAWVLSPNDIRYQNPRPPLPYAYPHNTHHQYSSSNYNTPEATHFNDNEKNYHEYSRSYDVSAMPAPSAPYTLTSATTPPFPIEERTFANVASKPDPKTDHKPAPPSCAIPVTVAAHTSPKAPPQTTATTTHLPLPTSSPICESTSPRSSTLNDPAASITAFQTTVTSAVKHKATTTPGNVAIAPKPESLSTDPNHHTGALSHIREVRSKERLQQYRIERKKQQNRESARRFQAKVKARLVELQEQVETFKERIAVAEERIKYLETSNRDLQEQNRLLEIRLRGTADQTQD